MSKTAIRYQTGLADEQRTRAAALYDLAFGRKFSLAIPSQSHRIALVASAFNPDFALVALCESRLVGLAGIQTAAGSLTQGITSGTLIRSLGFPRALRAMAVFSIHAREAEPGELVMDGITVDPELRGTGIGTRLLEMVIQYARDNSFQSVGLDVIDTNPGARKHYERPGFVAVTTERFAWLCPVLGFGASTRMRYRLC